MKTALTLLLVIVLVYVMETPATASQGQPYEAHCDEPLPIFTLGEKTNPTKAQEKALCACIWKNLGNWEREASEKFRQGKESEVSSLHQLGFPSRFRSAIQKCGGMNF